VLESESAEVMTGGFISAIEYEYALTLPAETFELVTGGFVEGVVAEQTITFIPLSQMVYTQSSVYFSNDAATVEAMTDESTEGSATGTDLDNLAFIQIDLGDQYVIDRIVIGTATTALPGGWDKSYTENLDLEYSLDGETWINFGNTGELEDEGIYVFNVIIAARYVRIAKESVYLALTEFYPLAPGQPRGFAEDIFLFSGPFIDALQDIIETDSVATGPFIDVLQDIVETSIITTSPHVFDVPNIGEPFEGGFFAGYISHNQDGVATHALVVAPKATGESGTLRWYDSQSNEVLVNTGFDGAVNTQTLAALGINKYPAANFCFNLDINGYSDWYLPSLPELNIAYFNLKPTSAANTGFTVINPYSVPIRDSSSAAPSVTSAALFNQSIGGSESFDPSSTAPYWSSSSPQVSSAQGMYFINGSAFTTGTSFMCRVRAFRKVPL